MCKLLCILDIENEAKALKFAELAVKPMTDKDNDGLGLVTLGVEGLGVERWLKPSEFPNTQYIDPKLTKYGALLSPSYNEEGSTSQGGVYAIGVHSRMATTPKTLENVHPFVREGVALIHNGVISNHEKFKKEVSTCDSEALLSLYLSHNVKVDLQGVQKVCDEVTGYYAFMVFNPETHSVDIVKDDRASLWFGAVEGIGTVFCTSPDIIKNVCGRLKLKQPSLFCMPGNTGLRWTKDKETLETITLEDTPPVYTSYLTAEKCLHGVSPKRWCHECTDGLNSDFPEWLQDEKKYKRMV